MPNNDAINNLYDLLQMKKNKKIKDVSMPYGLVKSVNQIPNAEKIIILTSLKLEIFFCLPSFRNSWIEIIRSKTPKVYMMSQTPPKDEERIRKGKVKIIITTKYLRSLL